MSCLESLPEEHHSLPFHEYFSKTIPIAALNKKAIPWHQRLIHCGSHSLKSASLYVDRVPNLFAFNFDDILQVSKLSQNQSNQELRKEKSP